MKSRNGVSTGIPRSVPVLAGFVFGLAAAACGSDTYTPDSCSPLPEYDIRELYAEENADNARIQMQRARVERAVELAASKGCLTEPRFTPRLSDVQPSKRSVGSGLELASEGDAGVP